MTIFCKVEFFDSTIKAQNINVVKASHKPSLGQFASGQVPIQKTSIKKRGDSQTKKPKKNTFTPLKEWETRLMQTYRGDGKEVKVISPLIGNSFSIGKPLEFEWNNPNNGPVFIGIINNSKEEVFYSKITDSKITINPKEKKISPGIYYWILENDDDVLFTGKFYYGK